MFLEEQIKVFFEAYGLGIDACIQAGDPHYLVLTMQRHTRLYQNLFFFESLAFLKQDEVERLKKELQEKLQKFHEEVLAYVQKMSEYATQMTPVITHIRRLI